MDHATLPQAVALFQALWPNKNALAEVLDLLRGRALTDADVREGVGRFLDWCAEERLLRTTSLPTMAPALDMRAAVHTINRRLLEPRSDKATAPPPGVGRDVSRLADLLAVGPKALSNSLAQGHQPRRPDHLWIAALAALDSGPAPAPYLFHERTPAGNTTAWTRALHHARSGRLDAWDRLFVFSLVMLYQRRRPTREARGNRGRPLPRRRSAKPGVGRRGAMISRGRASKLWEQARSLNEPARSRLAWLVIEWWLTDAHLLPHAPVRNRPVDVTEAWHDVPWLASKDLAPVIGAQSAALVDFRVKRMLAYQEGLADPLEPDPTVASHAHVQATLLLEGARRDPRPDLASQLRHTLQAGYADERGLGMLLPQLRRTIQRLEL